MNRSTLLSLLHEAQATEQAIEKAKAELAQADAADAGLHREIEILAKGIAKAAKCDAILRGAIVNACLRLRLDPSSQTSRDVVLILEEGVARADNVKGAEPSLDARRYAMLRAGIEECFQLTREFESQRPAGIDALEEAIARADALE